MLIEQRGLDEVFTLARSLTLRFAGIGIVDARAASLAPLGMIGQRECDEMARAGGTATPEAISAVLAGGRSRGQFTSEGTAAALVGPRPDG